MPNSEMMKLTHRYGWKFVVRLAAADRRERSRRERRGRPCPRSRGRRRRAGAGTVAGAVVVARCGAGQQGMVCAGIWLTVSVTSSAPPVSARMNPLP